MAKAKAKKRTDIENELAKHSDLIKDKKVKVKEKKVIGSQEKYKKWKVGTEFQRLSTCMSPNSLYLAIKSLSKN